MAYQWNFMDEGAERVRNAGRSVGLYVQALNPPELGDGVWQKDPEGCGFPLNVRDAASAIAALAVSVEPGAGGFAALQTIVDLADWIKGQQAED